MYAYTHLSLPMTFIKCKNDIKIWILVLVYKYVNWYVPAATPTNSTHTHPDQASWALFICSQMPSCFFLMMWRCRMRSLAMSRSQSMVWKSSYWPIPGGRSSKVSMRLEEPEKGRWGLLHLPYFMLNDNHHHIQTQKQRLDLCNKVIFLL